MSKSGLATNNRKGKKKKSSQNVSEGFPTRSSKKGNLGPERGKARDLKFREEG